MSEAGAAATCGDGQWAAARRGAALHERVSRTPLPQAAVASHTEIRYSKWLRKKSQTVHTTNKQTNGRTRLDLNQVMIEISRHAEAASPVVVCTEPSAYAFGLKQYQIWLIFPYWGPRLAFKPSSLFKESRSGAEFLNRR